MPSSAIFNGRATKFLTQTMRFPQMTTAARTALTSLVDGESVYDTDLDAVFTVQNGAWAQTSAVAEPSGQVVFGTGTAVDSDSNLSWDNTNKRLGIGTNAPARAISVSGTGANGNIGLTRNDNLPPVVVMQSTNSGGQTASTVGVGSVLFNGTDAGGVARNTSSINGVAAENITNTSSAGYLQFLTTPTGSTTLTERMRITSAGVVDVLTGQIKFPASQNASSDANTLDDYEEGTWTPSVGGTATYTSRTATYTKIGRMVYFNCDMTINSIGTGSTQTISGLPFTIGSNGSGAVAYWASFTASVTFATIFLPSGTSNAEIYGTTVALATAAPLLVLGNSSRIVFSGCYSV